jgi:hypothetical protein
MEKVNNDESTWVWAWWVVLEVLKLDYFGLDFFGKFELGTVLTLYLVNSMGAAELVCCSVFLFGLFDLLYMSYVVLHDSASTLNLWATYQNLYLL